MHFLCFSLLNLKWGLAETEQEEKGQQCYAQLGAGPPAYLAAWPGWKTVSEAAIVYLGLLPVVLTRVVPAVFSPA